jgi:hypothetical protein
MGAAGPNHDFFHVLTLMLIDPFLHLLREEEHQDAYEETYRRLEAGFDYFQLKRDISRLPSKN